MNRQHIKESYEKMGKNFMTPDVIDYRFTKDYKVIELSKGHAIDGKQIWGVTEFETIDGRLQTTRRGQMHTSLKSARKHFNILLGCF